MSKASPHPVVRMQHMRNRTPTGKRTVTPARKAAVYFAFGRDANRADGKQRGEWLGPDGERHKHEDVLAWSLQQARQHEHTFQALLTVPEARLTGEDYACALESTKQIADWRMVVHNDTDYSHAHVLFFRDRRLPRLQFTRWQAQVQQALVALEAKRLAEPAQEVEIGMEVTEEDHVWRGPELG